MEYALITAMEKIVQEVAPQEHAGLNKMSHLLEKMSVATTAC